MIRIKIVDLYNVKFEQMEGKVNQEIIALESKGNTVIHVKVLGDSLKSACIFLIYE